MNQKKMIIFIILLLGIVFKPTLILANSFRIGFHFGEPNAILIIPNSRMQIGVGDIGSKAFHIHADYRLKQTRVSGNLFYYISAGIQMAAEFWDHPINEKEMGVAFRLPFGFSSYLSPNFDIFFEVVPVQHLTPHTTFEWQWGVGIRFRL